MKMHDKGYVEVSVEEVMKNGNVILELMHKGVGFSIPQQYFIPSPVDKIKNRIATTDQRYAHTRTATPIDIGAYIKEELKEILSWFEAQL